MLRYNNTPVYAVNPVDGLTQFLSFLSTFQNPVLVGHNIQEFDLKVLYNAMPSDVTEKFNETVVGFVDTLPVFKLVYPALPKYTQSFLVNKLTGSEYNAHNALDDVVALCNLCKLLDKSTLRSYMFSKEFVREIKSHSNKVKSNLITLRPLVDDKTITLPMANKIAESGLNYSHLCLAVKRGGYDALESVFKEQDEEQKPRVTKTKRIILAVHNRISKCNS